MSGAVSPEGPKGPGEPAPGGRHGRAADISTAGRDSAEGGREDAPKDAERAAVLAYARRLLTNAERVYQNDAAGPDAREQALHWVLLLVRLLDVADGQLGDDLAADLPTLLRHWERLLGRMNDEIRAGLHRPDADGE